MEGMTQPDLSFCEGGPEDAARIETELLTALRASQPQAVNDAFVLTVKDGEGVLAAGLTAGSSYGWLLIKSLWVSEEYRRQGLARRLMLQAEEQGLRLGCHAAWLDTSNLDAKRCYERLGYQVFGELKNEPDQHPASHCRWFMKKGL